MLVAAAEQLPRLFAALVPMHSGYPPAFLIYLPCARLVSPRGHS